MKYFLLSVFVFFGLSYGQDVPDAGIVTPPWADNALAVLIVTTILGVLQMVGDKLPGALGKTVRWIVDLLSANVKHK